jgi:hypothetical protein
MYEPAARSSRIDCRIMSVVVVAERLEVGGREEAGVLAITGDAAVSVTSSQ